MRFAILFSLFIYYERKFFDSVCTRLSSDLRIRASSAAKFFQKNIRSKCFPKHVACSSDNTTENFSLKVEKK